MNKVVNISILLLLFIFISFRINTACNELRKTNNSKISPDSISPPDSYSGIISCDDCPDQHYSLTLEELKFTEVIWYSDSDNNPNPIINEGIWQIKDDTLQLFEFDKNNLLKTFLIDENEIVLINQKDDKQFNRPEIRFNQNADFKSIYKHHQRLKADGTVFIGSGNEPFWNIRIDNTQTLIYQTPDTSFSTLADAIKSENGHKTFQATNDNLEIIIKIEETYCQDSMSGFLFTHAISLRKNGSEFKGCGQFLE